MLSSRIFLEKYVENPREQLKDKIVCLDPDSLKHVGDEISPKCIKLHGSPKVDINIGKGAVHIEANIPGAQLVCGSAEILAGAVKVERGTAFLAPLYALAIATNDEKNL